jgi:nitrite reductase/ring-hydroxylating ferredoxin subunit
MTNNHHIQLCHTDDIPQEAARGFSTDITGANQEVFVVNEQGHFFGYINSCPHTGAPLEWMPNQFLSLDKQSIQCSLHGARFTIDEGFCIQGPCAGQGLTPIKLEITNNIIYWCHSEHRHENSK